MALTQATTSSAGDPARSARRRIAAMSMVIVAAITAACALAGLAAASRRARVDLTATGSFTLAQRTQRVLDSLEGAYEIVVVASSAHVEPSAIRRVDDLLMEMAHARENLRWTRLDPASSGDAGALARLLDRLALRDAERVSAQVATAQDAIADVQALAERLRSLAQGLARLRGALPPGDANMEALRNQEGVLRLYAERAIEAAAQADRELEARVAGSSLPRLAPAGAALAEAVSSLPAQLGALATALATLYPAGAPEPDAAHDAAQGAVATAHAAREEAARALDAARGIGDVDALRVARLLERENAVVVIGPERVTAVAFDALFPDRALAQSLGATEAEVRFAGEELLAAALAAHSATARPIVVFVHAAPAKQFDEQGKPASAQAAQALGALVDRLSLYSIQVREWPASLEPDPPALPRTDELGARLVPVWALIPTAVSSAESAANMGTLASAAQTLLERGEPMLISAMQSRLPGVGEPDPQVAFLERVGVRVDTGKALLERRSGSQSETIAYQHAFRSASREHPIGAAIDGRTVLLTWIAPVHQSAEREAQSADFPPDARFWPILTLPNHRDRWAEAQWASLQAAVARGASTAAIAQPNPSVDDTQGPWTVAAAVEWRRPDRQSPQRLVVVGAHQWFFDPFTQSATQVDGRRVAIAPGNTELFEASVHWLAGLDEMIAAASLSRDVPRIKPLSPAALGAIRWSVGAGLPLAVLLAGFALRLLRP